MYVKEITKSILHPLGQNRVPSIDLVQELIRMTQFSSGLNMDLSLMFFFVNHCVLARQQVTAECCNRFITHFLHCLVI